jgi:BirA family transcriptional regulator, biotin operon repressor / biotin---[acetyl-CoA-carboxylase] ligase
VTGAELDRALDAAAARLGAFTRVEFLPETGSTNDIALQRAHAGAPHGTIVMADMQTAGRGRRGRAWHSPPEAGVYLSAVVRAEAWAGTLSLLTLAAGVAVARAIRSATGLVVELKWPNDVVVGRPWRKLAGILSETASATPRVDAVVIGIGVNVREGSFPPEIAHRATALEIELGRPVDRVAFVIELLAALAAVTDELSRGQGPGIVDAWRSMGGAGLGNAPVRWNDGGTVRRGLARDLADDGSLLVDCGGRIERLVGGEVIWDRLSSTKDD